MGETVFGLIRSARYIEFALGDEVQKLQPGSERDLAQVLAYRLLVDEITEQQAHNKLPDLDWRFVAGAPARVEKIRDDNARFGVAHSIPDWLAERLQKSLGAEEAAAFMEAANVRAPLTLRANLLKNTREELSQRLRDDGVENTLGRFGSWAVTLNERPDVWSLAAFKEGLFEVQDEGSQLLAELAAPPPKGVVLDACAGGGGKTLAIGAMMQSKGRILAIDIDDDKITDLKTRCRRAGLSCVQAMVTPSDSFPAAVAELTGKFDRILVDAPCSGVGSLRRNPELRWRLTSEDIERLIEIQNTLVRRAAELLAPGGRLVYGTCTVLPEENEEVIDRLTREMPNMVPMRVAEIWGNERAKPISDPTGTYLKLSPQTHGTDGFFGAVVRRVS